MWCFARFVATFTGCRKCALEVQADLTQQKLDEAGERLDGPASGADALRAERAALDALAPEVRDLERAEAQAAARPAHIAVLKYLAVCVPPSCRSSIANRGRSIYAVCQSRSTLRLWS